MAGVCFKFAVVVELNTEPPTGFEEHAYMVSHDLCPSSLLMLVIQDDMLDSETLGH